MSADAYFTVLAFESTVTICSRRRQTASSMATKRQSVDCREREAVAKATKRQSAEYREKEAQAMP